MDTYGSEKMFMMASGWLQVGEKVALTVQSIDKVPAVASMVLNCVQKKIWVRKISRLS
jgi:hypothetical protein